MNELVQSRPCSKTISVPEMSNQRLKSETDFFTHECQCQAESVSGAGFRWLRCKTLRTICKVMRDATIYKTLQIIFDLRAFEPVIIARPEK
jgi:hypothetical protein